MTMGPSERVGVVDCGTNTIRLLIAEPDGHGGLREHDRQVQIVRLGQNIDATGEFHPDALQRTFAAADGYADMITSWSVPRDRVRFLATSASRDARNRDIFFDGIRQRLGAEPEVITGTAEARLAFRGALSGIEHPDEPVLVMDIGGGSTELITGTASGVVSSATSLDIGSVRLTERCWTADPPTNTDLASAAEFTDTRLDRLDIDWRDIRSWIGVAGTLTTLAAVHLELPRYDREQVHRHRISSGDLHALYDRLSSMPSEAIAQFPTVPSKRADVITAGTLIATRISGRLGAAQLTVSETDILDGAALELFESA